MHRIELSSKFITAERKNRDVNSCKLPCRLGDNNYHGGKIPVDTVDRSRISAVRMNSIKRDRHRWLQDEALGL